MKGAKPKPAEVKRRTGSRRVTDVNLVGGRRVPKMPAGLPSRAKTVWKQLIADMGESGVLDGADWPLVEVAAVTICRMREARDVIAREGLFVEGQRGPTKHPAYMIERECAAEVRQLLDHLGIGPVGRSRLGLAKAGKKSMTAEMDDQIGRKGLALVEGGRS
jgi:P27 family predicted phage terminase small subunit